MPRQHIIYIYIVESPVNSAPEHFGGSDPLKEKDRPASIKGKLHLLPSGGINWKSSCCTALQEKEQIEIFYHELQSLTLYQCLTRKPNGNACRPKFCPGAVWSRLKNKFSKFREGIWFRCWAQTFPWKYKSRFDIANFFTLINGCFKSFIIIFRWTHRLRSLKAMIALQKD